MTEKEKKRLDEILDEATKQEEVVEAKKETDLQEQVAKESNRETPIFEGIYSEIKNEEEKELSDFSTRRVGFIFVILGVVALALVIILCIVISGVTQKDKQEVATKQQPSVEVEAEEQPTIIEEEVTEVVEESTPEPTAEPTPEPTEEPKQATYLEEYIAQLDPNEICVVVWNENTNRQEMFKSGEKCIVKEGDSVVVPVANREIMSVYYGDVSQNYNEKGYYVVNIDSSEWLVISITYETESDEYNTIFLTAKKE